MDCREATLLLCLLCHIASALEPSVVATLLMLRMTHVFFGPFSGLSLSSYLPVPLCIVPSLSCVYLTYTPLPPPRYSTSLKTGKNKWFFQKLRF